MKLENIRREDWLLAGLAVLLVVCLVFLPWFTISVGALSVSFSATSAPDGWLAGLALLPTLAVIGDIGMEHLAKSELPAIGGSRAQTRLILAAVAAAFVLLKFVFHIHFSLFGWGFYATIVVTAVFVLFALWARAAQASQRATEA